MNELEQLAADTERLAALRQRLEARRNELLTDYADALWVRELVGDSVERDAAVAKITRLTNEKQVLDRELLTILRAQSVVADRYRTARQKYEALERARAQ